MRPDIEQALDYHDFIARISSALGKFASEPESCEISVTYNGRHIVNFSTPHCLAEEIAKDVESNIKDVQNWNQIDSPIDYTMIEVTIDAIDYDKEIE